MSARSPKKKPRSAPSRFYRRLTRARRQRLPGRMRALQLVRRCVQASVLLALISIPVFSLYENLRNQRDDIGIEARFDTRLVDGLLRENPERRVLATKLRGSVWTLKAGDTVVSDPLAVVDFSAAARDVVDPFLLTALIPLLVTLLLGRVFCGWLCPADLLFEVGSTLRRWAGIETNVTFSRWTKFCVLGLGALAGFYLGTQVFAEIYPPRVVSGELYLWITFGAGGAGAWLLLLIVSFEVFASRRFWCRYACPGGALYSLLGTFRVLRLKVRADRCTQCSKCVSACEFGLSPMSGKIGNECNNCGHCVRACGLDALTWRIGPRPKDGFDIIAAAERSAARETSAHGAKGTVEENHDTAGQ